MASGLAGERVFGAIARLVTDHPGRVIAVVVIVVLAAGALVPGLLVSTSRTGLVTDEDPQQQRMNAFYERFGRPDAPVFLVEGGAAEQRREVVDALARSLRADPELGLAGRVLGRIEPEDVASVLLLQQPDALVQLRRSLPPDTDIGALLEHGIVAWMGGLADRIEGGLEGAQGAADQDAPPRGAPPGADAEGLERLATVATLLEDRLAGRDPMTRFVGQTGLKREGVDELGYVTTADGGAHLVTVYLELDSDEGRVLEPIVERLRSVRDEVLAGAPAGVTADLTGLPGLSVDELAIVRAGIATSSVATTLGIFVLCLALFRSVRQTIVALIPLAPGVVVTLAAIHILYDDLNLITSGFVAVLLGLGIDFSVHYISRRNEQVRRGDDERTALRTALRHTGPGIMTGALVTSAAFLTTSTTDFTAYGELGIATSIGLVVIMLATFFLLPPLLIVGKRTAAKAAPEPPGIGLIPGLVRRSRTALVAIAVLAGIAGAVALPKIGFDPRYFGFLPDKTESARALKAIEYDPVASPVFAALTADSMQDARAKAEALREFDTVASVQSPSDLLPPLTDASRAALRAGFEGIEHEPNFEALAAQEVDAEALAKVVRRVGDDLDEARFALETADLPSEGAAKAVAAFESLHETITSLDDAGKARLATLHPDLVEILRPAWQTARAVAQRGHYAPTDVPDLFAWRFVSGDETALALYAVPAGQFWESEVANRFSADVRSVDPNASGLAMIHVAHGQMVLAGFRRAAVIAAGVIVLLLLADFRSFVDALLALLPTGLGWLWMLGLMVLFDLRFNVANIVALPLVLGIGIAFGVHMMHRVREAPVEGDAQGRPTLDEVVRGTGGAIAVAALTTMVGFAGLTTADYGGMKSLGLVMVIGIACSLVATVFVLPAVLSFLRRAT